MRSRTKFRHLPTRLAAGSFILDAGIGKLGADDDKAKQLQAVASRAYPFLSEVEPQTFAKALALGEIGLGGALLLPLVSSRLAGLGLGAFAAGLLGIYAKTPEMRRKGSVRPSQAGVPLAKDVWLLGIALALVVDRAGPRRRRKNTK